MTRWAERNGVATVTTTTTRNNLHNGAVPEEALILDSLRKKVMRENGGK